MTCTRCGKENAGVHTCNPVKRITLPVGDGTTADVNTRGCEPMTPETKAAIVAAVQLMRVLRVEPPATDTQAKEATR